ncbi:MAG: PstS family phosphate ABC transporter substrate-binding protein [Pleurocapsa sp. MO_226.B13]|nr:PstS family phosphate ABC transporter substrate-binding protein [Pleurocapsa sp. MO_226.B13]
MNTSQPTVLLFQPSKLQAEIWRFVLREYNISVVWNKKYIDERQIAQGIEKLESELKILIIDLKMRRVYEICRYFRQQYPSLKIIVTTNPRSDKYKELALRRWLGNQEVDELLINFHKQNLLSVLNTNLNCVLRILEYSPANSAKILKIANFLKQKHVFQSENTVTPQLPPASLNSANISTRNKEKTRTKIVFPLIYSSFFIITFIIVTVTGVSNLLIVDSLQVIKRKSLAHSQEQIEDKDTDTVKVKASTFEKTNVVPQGIYNYGGSTTWAPIRQEVNPQLAEKYPKFHIRYVPPINATPGSGTGIRMLLEGELDFSQSSRPIKPEEHVIAHQQGFTLRNYHVAIDAIAVAVKPSLPVSGLTMEQLKKIYTGKITNWKEVNGPDLEIIPLSRKAEDGGTPEFFHEHVLHDEDFGSNVKYVYSTTDGLKQVVNIPGAIYYASAPEVVPQCTVKALSLADQTKEFVPPYLPPLVNPSDCPQQRNQLNQEAIKNATYPLTRYLSAIVKQDGSRAQKAGEAYAHLLLSKEMQELVEQAGFVPINNVEEK